MNFDAQFELQTARLKKRTRTNNQGHGEKMVLLGLLRIDRFSNGIEIFLRQT